MSKSLINTKGFSLVEILSSVAVMGVIALGAMKISSVQKQSLTGNKGTIELVQTINEISGILKSPGLCTKNLGGRRLSNNVEVEKLVDLDDNDLIIEQTPLKSGVFQVKQMVIGDYESTTGRATFKVDFELVKDTASVREISKTLYFYPNVSGSDIVDCFRVGNDKAESLLEKMCFDIDGVAMCTYQNILRDAKEHFCEDMTTGLYGTRFDSTTGRCTLLDAGQACAAGQFFQKYDASGEITPCFNPPPPPSDINRNGVCGAQTFSCSQGHLVIVDNNLPDVTWRCEGTGTGSNAACNDNVTGATDGECDESVINGCNAGTLVDTADNASYYLWRCDGIGSPINDNCQKAKAGPPPAVCDNGSINTCLEGSLNDIPDVVTHYLWQCLSVSGNADCAMPKSPPDYPVCNETVVNGCSQGLLDDIADSATDYLWNCVDTGGIENCIRVKPVGQCHPTDVSCTVGIEENMVETPTKFNWDCVADGGADNCEKIKDIDGECDNSIENGCTAGTLNDIPDSASDFLWQCLGVGSGTDAIDCSRPIAITCNYSRNLTPSLPLSDPRCNSTSFFCYAQGCQSNGFPNAMTPCQGGSGSGVGGNCYGTSCVADPGNDPSCPPGNSYDMTTPTADCTNENFLVDGELSGSDPLKCTVTTGTGSVGDGKNIVSNEEAKPIGFCDAKCGVGAFANLFVSVNLQCTASGWQKHPVLPSYCECQCF